MSFEIMYKNKYLLPDGSIFIEEMLEEKRYPPAQDEIDRWYDGSLEKCYYDMHKINPYFEINNGNWEIKSIFVKHPDWVESYTTYEFVNNKKVIKLQQCKIIK